MVKIQTHRGHSLQQGPPDRTMAQKLHLESSPPPQPPAPSQVTPNLKVPCKKLDFCLAPGTHTALPLLHPSDSQRGLHTHSCAGIQLRSARTAQKLGAGGPAPSTRSGPRGSPRPSRHPPRQREPQATAQGLRGWEEGKVARRVTSRWDVWVRDTPGTTGPRCCPGGLRLTCSCR